MGKKSKKHLYNIKLATDKLLSYHENQYESGCDKKSLKDILTEIDENSKFKFRKFILNIIDIPTLKLSIDDTKILIEGAITYEGEASSNRGPSQAKVSKIAYNALDQEYDDYINITIFRERGFSFKIQGAKNIIYSDATLFSDIESDFIKKIKDRSISLLNLKMDEILSKSGRIRQFNLEELS